MERLTPPPPPPQLRKGREGNTKHLEKKTKSVTTSPYRTKETGIAWKIMTRGDVTRTTGFKSPHSGEPNEGTHIRTGICGSERSSMSLSFRNIDCVEVRESWCESCAGVGSGEGLGRGRGMVWRRDDLRAWERMEGGIRFVRSKVRQKSSFELFGAWLQTPKTIESDYRFRREENVQEFEGRERDIDVWRSKI